MTRAQQAISSKLSPLDVMLLEQLPKSLQAGYTNSQLRNYVGRHRLTQQQMSRALKSLEERGLVQRQWYNAWRCTEQGEAARTAQGERA